MGWKEDFGADAVAYEIESELKKAGIHKVKVSGDYEGATVEYTFRPNVIDYIYCKMNHMEDVELEVDANGDGEPDAVDHVLGKLNKKEFESYKGNELGWVKEVAKVVTPVLHEAVSTARKTVAKSLIASLISEHDLKQLVHTATGGEKAPIKWFVTQATKEVHAIVEVKSMENRKKVETALGKKGAKYNKSYRVDSPVVWVDVNPKGFEEHFEDNDVTAKVLAGAFEDDMEEVTANLAYYSSSIKNEIRDLKQIGEADHEIEAGVRELEKICMLLDNENKKLLKIKNASVRVAAEPEILSVQNNFEHYRVGKFHYIADDNDVHVTKDSGGSHNNVASYTYKNHEEACDMAWKMAVKQTKA
jgi:hypothetical protein